MEYILIPVIAILSLFVGMPLIITSSLHRSKKMKIELQKLEHQKDIAAMEMRKEQLMIERMALENKMLDRKIDQIEHS